MSDDRPPPESSAPYSICDGGAIDRKPMKCRHSTPLSRRHREGAMSECARTGVPEAMKRCSSLSATACARIIPRETRGPMSEPRDNRLIAIARPNRKPDEVLPKKRSNPSAQSKRHREGAMRSDSERMRTPWGAGSHDALLVSHSCYPALTEFP